MLITRSILPGMTLRITDEATNDHVYPTSHLQKGWLLFQNEQNLAEEAVGIGLPVLNTPSQTIFPGRVDVTQLTQAGNPQFMARYTLNLEERMARADTGELKKPDPVPAQKGSGANHSGESPATSGIDSGIQCFAPVFRFGNDLCARGFQRTANRCLYLPGFWRAKGRNGYQRSSGRLDH